MALTEADIDGMKVAELKEECRARGLLVGGKKAELQERLKKALAELPEGIPEDSQGESEPAEAPSAVEAIEAPLSADQLAGATGRPLQGPDRASTSLKEPLERTTEPSDVVDKAKTYTSLPSAAVTGQDSSVTPVSAPREAANGLATTSRHTVPDSRKRKAEDDDSIRPEPEPETNGTVPPPNDPVTLHATQAPLSLDEADRQPKRVRLTSPAPSLPDEQVNRVQEPLQDGAQPLFQRVYDPATAERSPSPVRHSTNEASAFLLGSASTTNDIQLQDVDITVGRLTSPDHLAPAAAQALGCDAAAVICLPGMLSAEPWDATFLYSLYASKNASTSDLNQLASDISGAKVYGDVLIARFVPILAPVAPPVRIAVSQLEASLVLAAGYGAEARETAFGARMGMMRLQLLTAGDARTLKADKLESVLRDAFAGR